MFTQKVFLTKTDTTIGFVSQNKHKLTNIKQRTSHKHYIKSVNSLHTLKTFARVPKKYKNTIRRSKKTTFILPKGTSYRVIYDKHHLLLLNRLKWAYTTSANLSGKPYDENYVKSVVDVLVEPLRYSNEVSTIYRLNNKTKRRIR